MPRVHNNDYYYFVSRVHLLFRKYNRTRTAFWIEIGEVMIRVHRYAYTIIH